LRPTDPVATLADSAEGLRQLNTRWGIRPTWSKRPIINAQAETAAEKPTFSQAFRERRCLVPCTGWYEWRDEGGARKTPYLFEPKDGDGFLMGGIWYPAEGRVAELVTLTTEATLFCADYHHRMPLLVPPECAEEWIQGDPDSLGHLLKTPAEIGIRASRV